MSHLDDLREIVTALLDTLGETADEVAERLRARGITGRPGDAENCPLARFLVSELGSEYEVFVGGNDVQIVPPLGYTSVAVDLAGGALFFVDRFDDYGYPELREPEPAPAA